MGIGFLIYFIFVICLGITSVFFVQFSALQIFFISLLIPVVMVFIVWHLYQNVRVEIKTKSPVAEKETLRKSARPTLLISVENTSTWLPLMKGTVYLTYENRFSGEKGKKKIHFSADCYEKQVKELPITIWHCGNVVINVKCVKVHDYFSIFSKTIKKNIESQSILVVPPMREIFLEEDALMMESEGDTDKFSPYKKGEDPSEIFDIRAFKEGDKLQRVHWKLSSKTQNLMVKEFSLPLSKATYILVDFYSGEEGKKFYQEMDRLIQGLYSISMELLGRNYPQTLVWFDKEREYIQEITVSKEEELFWALQEMFTCQPKMAANELIGAYSSWDKGMPHEAALYLTVSDEAKLELKELHIRHVQVIDMRTENGEGEDETNK